MFRRDGKEEVWDVCASLGTWESTSLGTWESTGINKDLNQFHIVNIQQREEVIIEQVMAVF